MPHEIECAGRDAIKRQECSDKKEDGRADQDHQGNRNPQPPDRRFESLRGNGDVARQAHKFGGHLAQSRRRKSFGNPLFQQFGGIDDAGGIECPVMHHLLAWRLHRSAF
jgi:hypothetical protein